MAFKYLIVYGGIILNIIVGVALIAMLGYNNMFDWSLGYIVGIVLAGILLAKLNKIDTSPSHALTPRYKRLIWLLPIVTVSMLLARLTSEPLIFGILGGMSVAAYMVFACKFFLSTLMLYYNGIDDQLIDSKLGKLLRLKK